MLGPVSPHPTTSTLTIEPKVVYSLPFITFCLHLYFYSILKQKIQRKQVNKQIFTISSVWSQFLTSRIQMSSLEKARLFWEESKLFWGSGREHEWRGRDWKWWCEYAVFSEDSTRGKSPDRVLSKKWWQIGWREVREKLPEGTERNQGLYMCSKFRLKFLSHHSSSPLNLTY